MKEEEKEVNVCVLERPKQSPDFNLIGILWQNPERAVWAGNPRITDLKKKKAVMGGKI